MKSVEQHISDLLFDHNCVIVQGLGGFVANYQSAMVHPTSYIFNSPAKSIAFNVNLKKNDGLLSCHIADTDSISLKDAEKRILIFVEEATKSLAENKPFKLQNIGRLATDIENNIRFIPDSSNNYLQGAYGLYSFNAQPIMRERETAIKYAEKITIRPAEKKRNRTSILLPLAAIVLLALLSFQVFMQRDKNGYNLAEIFGIENFAGEKEMIAAQFGDKDIPVNKNFIRKLRTVQTPVVEVNNNDTGDDEKSMKKGSALRSATYYVIAGAYGKPEYAQKIVKKLQKLDYDPFVLEKNDLFMVAIEIPADITLAKYRNSFAANSKIADAWVLKDKR